MTDTETEEAGAGWAERHWKALSALNDCVCDTPAALAFLAHPPERRGQAVATLECSASLFVMMAENMRRLAETVRELEQPGSLN